MSTSLRRWEKSTSSLDFRVLGMKRRGVEPIGHRSPHALHHGLAPEGAVISPLDPFAADFLESPKFQDLLDPGPVLWSSVYEIVMVARYQVVRQVLMDWSAFSSARGVGMADLSKHGMFRPPSVILEVDPPAHDRARAALNKALSPSVLRSLRDSFMRTAHEKIEGLVERGAFDAAADLAEAYPLEVFPRALGMRADHVNMLLPFGDMVFNSFGPPNERFQLSSTRAREVYAQIENEALREHLAPDGFGMRLYECADSGEITHEEAHKLVRALLTAGVDTTVNGLGAALYSLARAPNQWSKLRARPELARQAFEEAIRLESPVQTFFRTVTRPVELVGVNLAEGQKVLMFLGAANRDPRQWERPDEYDIERRAVGHVGLGAGVHMCVGQGLARLEAECVLSVLAQKAKRIALDGAPTRRINNTLRGFASLPVRVERA
jgi:cytochrome P450